MENLRLPKNEVHLRQVCSYIEDEPLESYQHASAAAREAFRDIKFGVRIHWGLYTLWSHRDPQAGGESWPFLKLSYADRQEYSELYRQFNPARFDAGEWMDLFQRAGLRCFAFTSKHHEGFSLFDTQTRVRRRVDWLAPGGPQIVDCDLAYSVAETPFGRDIVGELITAARPRGIKVDLYFSHPDWFDADFRPFNLHPLQTADAIDHPEDYGESSPEGGYGAAVQNNVRGIVVTEEPAPHERQRMIIRHRQQLEELLTRYGKIDMLCLDQWLDRSTWPALRETIMHLRRLQPDVLLRARGIGNYGDYYTPEGFVPGAPENTDLPWMVIYPLARWFDYDPDGSCYHDSAWILKNLVDSTAKGGNFMVGIGPDADGWFHPTAVQALEEIGAWLARYGEAIYATRPRPAWEEGPSLRLTRSKDRRLVYAINLAAPESELRLRTVRPIPGSAIQLIGEPEGLPWTAGASGEIIIHIPPGIRERVLRQQIPAFALRIAAEGE